jgi:mono/diheme cytochrome c family protein
MFFLRRSRLGMWHFGEPSGAKSYCHRQVNTVFFSRYLCFINRRSDAMKSVCIMLAFVMLVAAPLTLWSAEDGAAIYKSKCSACHGEKGEGKPAMKMPAVKEISMTADQVLAYLTKGESGKKPPHSTGFVTNEEQAKAVTEFVKALK